MPNKTIEEEGGTPDKETNEILEEIKEEKEDKGEEEIKPKEPSQKEPESGEEISPEGGQKPEGEEEAGEGEEDKTFKRTPKTMLLWKHNIAEKKWEKKKEELENKIQELSSEKASPELDKAIENIAEKYGLETELLKEIVKLSQPKLSQEVMDKLERIEHQNEDATKQQQGSAYEADFSKNVLPLVKEEYPQASDKLIDRVRELLSKLAFTEELVNVPLDMIYKGSDQFRGVQGKKTAESSSTGGRYDKVSLEEVNPQDIENMSDAEFDKFSEAAAKDSKKFKIESRR